MQLWEPHHIPGNRAKWTGTVRFEGVAGTGADGQLLSHTSCAITPTKGISAQIPFGQQLQSMRLTIQLSSGMYVALSSAAFAKYASGFSITQGNA